MKTLALLLACAAPADDGAPPDGDIPMIPGDDAEDDSAGGGDDDAAYEALYDPDVIHEVRLTLDAEAIAALTADPLTYVAGDVIVDGVRLEEVGVRLKGSSSFRDFTGKPAFKIKFGKFRDQDYHRQSRLTLNNLEGDRAQAREVVAYRVWRAAGLVAPRASYARVYVNDELYGLYTNVEPMDADFVRHRYDVDGDLWEGEDPADFTDWYVGGFELKTGDGDALPFDGTVTAPFSTEETPYLEHVAAVADLDSLLDYWAWSLATGSTDAWPHHLDDVLVFVPREDPRMRFSPWGLDETWGDTFDWSHTQSILGLRCFPDAACVDALKTRVREALEVYETLDVPAIGGAAMALSEPEVAADPRRTWTEMDVRNARTVLRERLAGWPEFVRAEMGL